MKLFCTTDEHYKCHLLTQNNIKKHLNFYPYIQESQIFALCPYCKSVIQILSFSNSVKDYQLYCKHLGTLPKGFENINLQNRHFCVLRQKNKPFVKTIKQNVQLDRSNLNLHSLRRQISIYTGIYCSNKLIDHLLEEFNNTTFLQGIDYANFSFGLLLANQSITLNYRKIANPKIKAALEKSDDITISSSNQIFANDEHDKILMDFKIENNQVESWPSMKVSIFLKHLDSNTLILSFEVLCAFYSNTFYNSPIYFRKD